MENVKIVVVKIFSFFQVDTTRFIVPLSLAGDIRRSRSRKVRGHPGYLVGAVVLFHPGLEANVQVELVLLVVAGPGNLLEAIGFGVDELGVLGDGLVGVPDRQTDRQTSREKDRERVR